MEVRDQGRIDGTPIPKDKNRKSWNEFIPNKPYHHIPEENNLKYYDPKKWSFYDVNFPYLIKSSS